MFDHEAVDGAAVVLEAARWCLDCGSGQVVVRVALGGDEVKAEVAAGAVRHTMLGYELGSASYGLLLSVDLRFLTRGDRVLE